MPLPLAGRSPLLAAAALSLLFGCGTAAPPAPAVDAGLPPLDLALPSLCGHPGDVGNSIGVGKYCEEFSDCNGNDKAIFCVRIYDPRRLFCSLACEADGGAGVCGDHASCQCNATGCGCSPDHCVTPPDGGARD
ncbi:MAG: hypothetical protein EXR72_20695 [Myxococcales bacterium]|nr:hypothetical protein [Myxococcales bacterium]